MFTALDNYLSKLGNGSCRFDFELIYLNSIERQGGHDADGQARGRRQEGRVGRGLLVLRQEDDTMQELGGEFGEDLEKAKFHLEKMPG